ALPPPPDLFFARGRVRVVAGWQEVAGIGDGARAPNAREGAREEEGEEGALLPPLVEGQRLDGTFAAQARKTQPPRRYTEASLLSAMETAGRTLSDEALWA